MKVELLGTYGGSTNTNFLTSFLIDDYLAVDAGCLTQALSLERQRKITDVLVSHTHLDHTLSLPFLADNMFGEKQEPIRIWASNTVIAALKLHIFNEVTWPDFSRLPNLDNPTIVFCPLEAEVPVTIGNLIVTPIDVNHVVPTQGFLIECPATSSSLLYTADTTNTDRLWEIANMQENLKAIIADCSFPNAYAELARLSGHMTPEMLGRDLAKLHKKCPILVYHLKPMFEDLLIEELNALGVPDMHVTLQSKTFTW